MCKRDNAEERLGRTCQVTSVFVGVGVGMADEGDLVVVVEVGVGDRDPVGGVGDVAETVVVAVMIVSHTVFPT